MREAEVWRTLKPFHPSLISPSGFTNASAAPSPPAASAPRPDDHRRPLGLGERVGDLLGQLAEQLQIVAEPVDLHPQVHFRTNGEHFATLAHHLAQPRGDQRRFPANVGADQQHRVRALDPRDGRIERHRD